jgi:hypothetical protein
VVYVAFSWSWERIRVHRRVDDQTEHFPYWCEYSASNRFYTRADVQPLFSAEIEGLNHRFSVRTGVCRERRCFAAKASVHLTVHAQNKNAPRGLQPLKAFC